MKRLNEWLARLAKSEGLLLELDPYVKLPGGVVLHPLARFPDIGGSRGMLIFTDFKSVSEHTENIVDAGFGYSILDDLRQDEILSQQDFREMIIDWGWYGNSEQTPIWLRNIADKHI